MNKLNTKTRFGILEAYSFKIIYENLDPEYLLWQMYNGIHRCKFPLTMNLNMTFKKKGFQYFVCYQSFNPKDEDYIDIQINLLKHIRKGKSEKELKLFPKEFFINTTKFKLCSISTGGDSNNDTL